MAALSGHGKATTEELLTGTGSKDERKRTKGANKASSAPKSKAKKGTNPEAALQLAITVNIASASASTLVLDSVVSDALKKARFVMFNLD